MQKIGIDLDDTITKYPQFFSQLSQLWISAGGEVYIITFRSSCNPHVEQELLASYGIAYTDVIYANKDDDSKAKAIKELGVEVMFDDMPEFLIHVESDVACFLVRHEATNFDYNTKQFVFTKHTGRLH